MSVRDNLLALGGSTIFVLGNCKNAGKTTFLNYALPFLRNSAPPLGLLSIGVDGETTDLVFGTPKPRIRVLAGDYAVTVEAALEASDGEFTCLDVLPFTTVLGRILLLRCDRSGFLELVGPETNASLAYAIETLRQYATTILVDGAINRVTQSAIQVEQAQCIDVLKLTPESFQACRERILLHERWQNTPLFDSHKHAAWHICDGALTKAKLAVLPSHIEGLVVQHPAHVFLSLSEVRSLRTRLCFRNRWQLAFCVVHAYDVNFQDFLRSLPVCSFPIFENPYKIDNTI